MGEDHRKKGRPSSKPLIQTTGSLELVASCDAERRAGKKRRSGQVAGAHQGAEEQRSGLTEGLGQQVLDELGVIADVQDAVDAGVHQLLLVVAQVLGHVFRHEHDVALHVDHEEEAIQGLERKERNLNCLFG